jgi:Transposase DDE domain
MIMGAIFERFLAESPVCVMQRAILENVFAPEKLDKVFQSAAVRQYERELLFSQLVDLTSLVVCRVHPSVHAAYKEKREQVPVSLKALYDKLAGVEGETSRAFVRFTASAAKGLIERVKGEQPPLLPGFRVRILDGNHLSGTDRRLKVLRGMTAGALPGQALALLDPQRMIIDEVFPCEDGHAQERSLLHQVLPHLQPGDLVIDDRNFCTLAFLMGMARKKVRFITRQHGRMPYELQGKLRFIGRCETGRVYEQVMVIHDPETGEEFKLRRVTIHLKKPTRDGDKVVHLVTNLPRSKANAIKVADLYRKRWRLETAFQELTTHLRCELNTLGYPPAALFAFCVAVGCYNLLAVIKGALRGVHGSKTIEETLSNFYMTDEISGVYRGMMIALPPSEWTVFGTMSEEQFADLLSQWARRLDLTDYRKAKGRVVKPPPAQPNGRLKHVATAQLLPKKRAIVRTKRPETVETSL